MTQIFGYGLLTLDRFLILDRYPLPDEKCRAREISEFPGGPVPAALAFCARSGLDSTLCSRIGEDPPANMISDILRDHALNIRHIIRNPDVQTPLATILSDRRTSKRTVILSPGHQKEYLKIDWKDFTSQMQPGDHLLLDGRDTDNALALARIARDKGMHVHLDPGARTLDLCPWEDLLDDLIVSKDFIIRNYGETDLFTALQNLAKGKLINCAITLGPGGLLYSDGSGPQFLPAEKVNSIDSTGAGDIFHGAYIYARIDDQNFPDALKFAAKAAAYSTLFTGVFHQQINAANVRKHFH